MSLQAGKISYREFVETLREELRLLRQDSQAMREELRLLREENLRLRRDNEALRETMTRPASSGAPGAMIFHQGGGRASPADTREVALEHDTEAGRWGRGPDSAVALASTVVAPPMAHPSAAHHTPPRGAAPAPPRSSGPHRGAARGPLQTPTWPTPPPISSKMGAPLMPDEMPSTEVPDGVAPLQDGRQGMDLGFINYASDAELDALPYGLIILDSQGRVVFYNETESHLAGFSKAQVLGRSFFQEVAPCSRVKEFEGRFRDFVAGRLGPVVFFDFAFHFRRGTQYVTIGFSRGRKPGMVNVMLRRRTL